MKELVHDVVKYCILVKRLQSVSLITLKSILIIQFDKKSLAYQHIAKPWIKTFIQTAEELNYGTLFGDTFKFNLESDEIAIWMEKAKQL